MTLRTRLILTFIALGAVPLMVVGWVTSQRNLAAVEDLIAGETKSVARGVAEDIEVRYDVLRGELLFLAANAETLRLFGETALPVFAAYPTGPEEFLRQSWRALERHYRWIQFQDRQQRVLLSLPYSTGNSGDLTEAGTPGRTQREEESWVRGELLISETVRSTSGSDHLGTVSAAIRQESILPTNLPERGFGDGGFVSLVDTETGRILFHPQPTYLAQPMTQAFPLSRDQLNASLQVDGTLGYTDGEERWVGSVVPVPGTTWAVLSTSPLRGFAQPFRDVARTNFSLVLIITALTALAFLVSTLRTTRSLVRLTLAARKVSAGDLDPDLPPDGRDEVGTLAGTFQTMLGRIRGMIREVEESRQMAAVGEFSAQIAHELRNPLTAVQVSLQGLLRKLRDTEHERPLEIALQETRRLNRVASGVLTLGRKLEGEKEVIPVLALVNGAVQALQSELDERRVTVSVRDGSSRARVAVDEEALKGALINLIRNGMEAMPSGGALKIDLHRTESTVDEGPRVMIHVRDEGPGIPPELKEKVFDPFVTTKAKGNGFGLPLALRAVEASGGHLHLGDSGGPAGAHLILELPALPSTDSMT